MVSKPSGCSSKSRISNVEELVDGIEGLSRRLNQLKRQVQGARILSIKEKVENNRRKLETHISHLLTAASSNNSVLAEDNGNDNILCSRIKCPPCKFDGFPHGVGDKDYTPSKDVVSTSIKLPYMERIPPYTTWIFLDRNQRMAEEQSVVGRRQIYYDQHGGETLICSDSEEDIVEPEDEKHEFVEGEDHIIWTIGQEYGVDKEVFEIVGQFLGVGSSEIQERYSELKVKNEQNIRGCVDFGSSSGISLEKSLSAALDSFDNLFCRRCLVFDCRLHGCSQTLIDASEKQPYWSENEGDRNPCSEHCYLLLRAVKDIPEVNNCTESGKKNTTSEEEDWTAVNSVEKPHDTPEGVNLQTEKEIPLNCESYKGLETVVAASNSDSSAVGEHDHENLGKRNTLVPDDSDSVLDSTNKKQKTSVDLDEIMLSNISVTSLNQNLSGRNCDKKVETPNEGKVREPHEHSSENFIPVGGPSCSPLENSSEDGTKILPEVPELKQSSAEWKPIEKELYQKGVEIFGRNSCLIARNLLSGLKTCLEVSGYMRENGASVLHKSSTPSLLLEDTNDPEGLEREMPPRTRLFRRRGKTRKLKYSTKSAGHPSVWKRIAGGKNQSCKQYTPCGCQSMCGKQCPCLTNETCCEKYCGCSKSCKNRFRGCHCAKSQCRSRQCPCFAAGRECDPDVCRNCWVSCGDGTLGEPPNRGEGQCGNMRLLLRQQQRILLAKSDVAGWGAFLKNSVNKNEYLGEYTGELISHREADKRGKIYDRANSSFLFDLNDQYVLDAHRKGDKLKFANHSSKPNCYAKVMFVAGDHRVGIFANERIEASEELFYDYRYGPDQAPAWARKPEGSKKYDPSINQRRARKHQ